MSGSLTRALSSEQIELKKKMLTAERDSHCRAVSFKLCGVLAVKPLSAQSDIYLLMNSYFTELTGRDESFSAMRENAEEAALKKSGVITRVTLADIYKLLRSKEHISAEISEKLMQREQELEVEYSCPRDFAKELYREAKSCGKRVVIIADTCYPEETVKAVIEKCGYGSCDGLVMLREQPKANANSWVAPTLEKAGVKAPQLLHIGGDVTFDVQFAVMNGAKALLLPSPTDCMEKTGRVRGFCEKEALYDYDSPRYITLRRIFGLYAMWAFDVPQSKSFQSDFCGNADMMGFVVLGALGFTDGSEKRSELEAKLIEALEKNPAAKSGAESFAAIYEEYFGDKAENGISEGCGLPLRFIGKCCGEADRKLLSKQLSPTLLKKWASSVAEPEIVPIYEHNSSGNALSRLADRMFPPGTKVRTMSENILGKVHLHSDKKKH